MKKVIGRKAEWLKKEFFTPNTNAYLLLSNDYVDFLEFDFIAQYTDKGTSESNKYISIFMTNEAYVGAIGLSSYTMYGGLYLRGNGKTIRTGISDFKTNSKHVIFTKDNDDYILAIDDFSVRNATTKGNITIGPRTNSHGEVFYKNVRFVRNNIKYFLSPIQLTSSLPAYLASDNLPHAAGECGMWDSVSEKFYGNANSVGAFSVENELDEYVEVDLTGICINGKYQRVAVENSEIPRLMHNGKEVRAMMMNGKVVWKEDVKTHSMLRLNKSVINTDIQYSSVAAWQDTIRIVSGSQLAQSLVFSDDNYIAGTIVNNLYSSMEEIRCYAFYNGMESSQAILNLISAEDIVTTTYDKLNSSIKVSYADVENNYNVNLHDNECVGKIGKVDRAIDIFEVKIELITGKKILLKPAVDCGKVGLYDVVNKTFYKSEGGTAEVYN